MSGGSSLLSREEDPEAVRFEQMFLMAIVDELRGLRADIAKLSKPSKKKAVK